MFTVPADHTLISATGFDEVARTIRENGQTTSGEAMKILATFERASATIRQYFPGARDGKYILDRTTKLLHEMGLDDSELTLFGQSICPDEINHYENSITVLFTKYMGEVFHLGGLGGVPFSGKTGFKAFSSHVPDGGNLFILFAPHIGLSDSMVLGKFSRLGQESDGSACGAACGALSHCNNCAAAGEIPKACDAAFLGSNPDDYQMNTLIAEVNSKREGIMAKLTVNEQQAELARQIFEISKAKIDRIVDTDFGHGHGKKSKLILLGGIQINMPHPMPDHFEPLMFEIRSQGEETVDLLHKTFARVGEAESPAPTAEASASVDTIFSYLGAKSAEKSCSQTTSECSMS